MQNLTGQDISDRKHNNQDRGQHKNQFLDKCHAVHDFFVHFHMFPPFSCLRVFYSRICFLPGCITGVSA